MRVAVLGLGIIGSIWAKHYEADGLLAATWNRSAKPEAPRFRASALEAAQAAELIQIVIADPPAVEQVLRAIAPALGPDKVIVQSSTIDPKSSERFQAFVAERGARYVEAPFTGSKPAAEARQTVYYLGGSAEALARVESVLSRVSAQRFVIGSGAQAATLKLAMNVQIACILEGLSESLVLARAAGITDDTFFRVLEHNVAYSGVVKLKEKKLRDGDFSPQFSIKHLHKDIRLALGAFGDRAAPETSAVREQLRRAEARGYGDEDITALLKLL